MKTLLFVLMSLFAAPAMAEYYVVEPGVYIVDHHSRVEFRSNWSILGPYYLEFYIDQKLIVQNKFLPIDMPWADLNKFVSEYQKVVSDNSGRILRIELKDSIVTSIAEANLYQGLKENAEGLMTGKWGKGKRSELHIQIQRVGDILVADEVEAQYHPTDTYKLTHQAIEYAFKRYLVLPNLDKNSEVNFLMIPAGGEGEIAAFDIEVDDKSKTHLVFQDASGHLSVTGSTNRKKQ